MSLFRRSKAQISHQVGEVMKRAGQTATWQQFASAGGGSPDAGLGDSAYYRQQTITALFAAGYKDQPEAQTPVGMLAGDAYLMTSREQVGRQDQLVWRGITYRIDGDPVPAKLPGYWMARIVRGK